MVAVCRPGLLDDRGEWDWAMDRAFVADRGESKAGDTPSSVDKLVEAALSSEALVVRRAAQRAQRAVDNLREAIAAEERREARAKVDRLNGELRAARARFMAARPTLSPANRRWREAQANHREIREWARSQGLGVLDRGTLSMRIVELYDKAHGIT